MNFSNKKGHPDFAPGMPNTTQSSDNCGNNYITSTSDCQEFSEYSENSEIEKKFVPKRKDSLLLSSSFRRLDYIKRAERVEECATFLEFSHEVDNDGVIADKGKLHYANFCRDRLCPMCSWRRSYKIFAQVSQIMKVIQNDYAFLFLTLTVPNVKDYELSAKINELGKNWRYFINKYPKVKKIIKGYFKCLEITRNHLRDDYHPHFHIVLAVPKDYFKKSDYIKRDEWLEMWRKCMGDDSISQVDVRRVKNKYGQVDNISAEDLSSAVAEVAKYAVKSGDYIFEWDNLLTDRVVSVFADVLHGRRLCEFDRNGVFGKAREKLKLDDCEDGDLIHLEDEKINPAVAHLICRYGWSAGVYKMTSNRVEYQHE